MSSHADESGHHPDLCVPSPATHTLAQRAHVRLSWGERLTRNARAPAEGQAGGWRSFTQQLAQLQPRCAIRGNVL